MSAHMLPIRDPPQNKRPTQTESEGLEKKTGIAIFLSDKIDFKTKAI